MAYSCLFGERRSTQGEDLHTRISDMKNSLGFTIRTTYEEQLSRYDSGTRSLTSSFCEAVEFEFDAMSLVRANGGRLCNKHPEILLIDIPILS